MKDPEEDTKAIAALAGCPFQVFFTFLSLLNPLRGFPLEGTFGFQHLFIPTDLLFEPYPYPPEKYH